MTGLHLVQLSGELVARGHQRSRRNRLSHRNTHLLGEAEAASFVNRRDHVC